MECREHNSILMNSEYQVKHLLHVWFEYFIKAFFQVIRFLDYLLFNYNDIILNKLYIMINMCNMVFYENLVVRNQCNAIIAVAYIQFNFSVGQFKKFDVCTILEDFLGKGLAEQKLLDFFGTKLG